MIVTHEFLVHAVIGKGFAGNWADESRMEARGLARYTGNQHAERWDWNKAELQKLTREQLIALYERF